MEIKVSIVLGTNELLLRGWADSLFTELEKSRQKEIVLDFSEISFISRSFAHEYLMQKKSFKKTLKEINLNESVSRMMSIAFRGKQKTNSKKNQPIAVFNL
jgi:hypothetical protein